MLGPGDQVVIHGMGIGTIDGVDTCDGAECYRVSYAEGRLLVPIDRAPDMLRPLVDAAEAERLFDLLQIREPVEDHRPWPERHAELQRVLAKGSHEEQIQTLQRLYASPYALSLQERKYILMYEDALLDELALALAKERPALEATLRENRVALSPSAPERPPAVAAADERAPQGPEIAGYELLGEFRVGDAVVVADPIYLAALHDDAADGDVSLNHRAPARGGTWFGYVAWSRDDRPSRLLAIHGSRVDSFEATESAAEPSAILRVDSGRMAILDRAVRDHEAYRDAAQFRGAPQGLIRERGCTSRSGWGDGHYPVLTTGAGDELVFVSIDFIGGAAAESSPGGVRAAPRPEGGPRGRRTGR